MWRPLLGVALLTSFLGPVSPAFPQQTEPHAPQPISKAAPSKPDYSREGVVFEKIASTFTYNADGTGSRALEVVARVQSDAAVRQFGVLSFPYASSNEHATLDYLRVRKPDGTVVETPAADIQDLPADVTRAAPLYSDLRELQIPIKSLSAGDTVEYRIRFDITQPPIAGQFWGASSWVTTNVALDESVVLSFPAEKYVQVLSPQDTPQISEDGGRKTYRWHSSQPKPTNTGTPPATSDPDAMPAIAWTTFHSWQEIGDWYRTLAKDRDADTPAIQSKVNALLAGKTTDDEKIETLYNYVSLQVRYIGVAFGVGRYQPHAADTVLDNQYGDCKDKSTLLIAMLKAAGFDAWPALIGIQHKLHPELPSPAQFDHVITVVPRGGDSVLWLDSTPEIAPWKMLLFPLRDKQALVIPTTGEPKLMRTPAEGPFPFTTTYTATAKLASDGSLSGHLSFTLRGDTEMLFRQAYRSAPRAQWEQMTQSISEGMGFAGTVSNLDVSPPDQTDQPFHFAYDYERKDYGDWADHRIPPLMTGVDLPTAGDTAKAIQLPAPQIETYHSAIELPSPYSAILPDPVHLTSPFATYEVTYKLDGNTLITDRKFQILGQPVTTENWSQYKEFADGVSANQNEYVQLVVAGAPRPDTTASNPDAVRLIQSAQAAIVNRDTVTARGDLQSAQQLNPRERNLWLAFGMVDLMDNQLDDAESDLRKEIQYHPDNTHTYQMLAGLEMRLQQTDSAIATLHDLLRMSPGDVGTEISLGSLLVLEKKYQEAATLLDAAAKQSKNPDLAVMAGHADILAGHQDAGEALLRRVLRENPNDPSQLNNAAYELSDAGLDLPLAESSCRKALDQLDQQTASILLVNLSRQDLQRVQLLTAVWDTLGWIEFHEGKIDEAESYVHAAWASGQSSEVGDHLGQIYEKEGRLQQAADTYALAIAANTLSPDAAGIDALLARQKTLAAKGYRSKYADPEGELGRERSIELPGLGQHYATADFFVLLSPGKVEDVRFIRGDDVLKPAASLLQKADFGAQFPQDSHGRLVRRGILACSGSSAGCQFTLLLPGSVSLN